MNDKPGQYFYNSIGTLQIILSGPGCFYRRHGYCKMCNYGGGHTLILPKTISFIESTLQKFPQARRILLGSNGSILDEREIPRPVLSAALKCINSSPVTDVYLETHAHTINAEILNYLQHKLPQKRLTIEMGLESSNPEVLKRIIHKSLDLGVLGRAIELIHEHHMSVALNVLYGLWYDPPSMQADFIQTCEWADANCADEIVAFLLHIRPGTYAYQLYEHGKLSPPAHADFIATLPKLGDQVLQKLYFSWFGERQDAISSLGIIPPAFGYLSPEKTLQFYYDFMHSPSVPKKRQLITTILATS